VKDGLAEFTPIDNQADIIFDTNEPIVTNQTINTLVTVLCTDKATTLEVSICDGESYEGFTEPGIYSQTFELPFECDSLVTIVLDVQEIMVDEQNLQVCVGDEIIVNEVPYLITENTIILDTTFNDNGCISNFLMYEVDAISDILGVLESVDLCLGETFSVNTPTDGSWISNDPLVITVDGDGNLATTGAGTGTLTFTDAQLGCTDDLSITVYPTPSISNEGSDQICINDSIILVTDGAGEWVSENQSVATINSDGIVHGIAEGMVEFVFTDSETGCTSNILLEVLSATDPMCMILNAIDVIESQVKVYPNPASESIIIQTSKIWSTIRIIDVEGKVVATVDQAAVGNLEVNVSHYMPGIYMVIFKDGNKSLTKRYVVSH